jgi:N-hydroxyarylamine O-acetyltransferase
VDVGFGDCFLRPLRLDERGSQVVAGQAFALALEGGEYRLSRLASGSEVAQYVFTDEPHNLADFEAMCHYHQTSSDSPFTRKRVCSRATVDGRITISNSRLIVTRAGEVSDTALSDETAFVAALVAHFGVDLGQDRATIGPAGHETGP